MTEYLLDTNHLSPLITINHPLRRQGWQLGTVDALVAAVALRYGCTLLTADKDFAAIPALGLENWLKGNWP
jgi:predicted nucleic acid-binding protein